MGIRMIFQINFYFFFDNIHGVPPDGIVNRDYKGKLKFAQEVRRLESGYSLYLLFANARHCPITNKRMSLLSLTRSFDTKIKSYCFFFLRQRLQWKSFTMEIPDDIEATISTHFL